MKWIFYILAASFTLAALLANAASVEDLLLYFPFDEGKGKEVEDLGPYKLKGEFKGDVKWTDGKYGKALEFGGPQSNAYVDVGYHKELEGDREHITVMAWIYPHSWRPPGIGGCTQVWGFGVHGGCGGRVQHGLFWEGGSLKIRFEAEGGRLDVSAQAPPENDWTHVAVTYDEGVGRIYLNGKLESEGQTSGPLKASNEPLLIAADCERIPQYIFAGVIDEFTIFGKVLEEKDIQELMEGIGKALSVQPSGKLATFWGRIKGE
jgi:hypothetical protein